MSIKISYIEETGLLFAVEKKHGKSARANLNLRGYKISPEVELEVARGFNALYGSSAIGGIRLAMRALRRLLESVSKHAASTVDVFPEDTLQCYVDHLKLLKLGSKAFASSLNAPRKLLRWLQRNGNCIPVWLDFIVEASPQQDQKADGAQLTEAEVKRIIDLCFISIEQTEARLTKLVPILGQDDSREGAITAEVLRLGKGKFVKFRELKKLGVTQQLFRDISAVGGYRYLISRTKFNISDVFGFYLALLCITGGNPEGFLYMSGQDIVPHPLRKDLERVYWDKDRAGKMQYQDFPAKKRWAAPEIVRRCLRLNADIRSQPGCSQNDMVFVCWPQGGSPRVPSKQSLHNMLNSFIKEHSLRNFDFKDLRVASARAHHKAGKSIIAAKKKLNHKSVSTTEIYTPYSQIANQHDAKILHFQGSFLVEKPKHTVVAKNGSEEINSGVAQTIFGFGCRDPLSGIAPDSQPGVLCLQFMQCATCPGAIIPIDDIEVVSRLLAAEKKLTSIQLEARAEGWNVRFKTLYEPTLKILREQILPKIPELARELAVQRSQYVSFPAID